MENKVIIEGILLFQPKLTEWGSLLFKIKNTTSYTNKDKKQTEIHYIATIVAKGYVAEEISKRLSKGDYIRIEGMLKKQKSKKLDEEGNEIWEDWINARKIDASVYQTNFSQLPQNLKPVITQQQTVPIKKEVPIFKQQIIQNKPQQRSEKVFNDEDPFGDRNDLPF